MNWLIVTPENQIELDAINARFVDRQCISVATNNGVSLTNYDKLQDIYWEAYHALLSTLTPFEGQPIWPTPTEELTETN